MQSGGRRGNTLLTAGGRSSSTPANVDGQAVQFGGHGVGVGGEVDPEVVVRVRH